MQFSNSGTLALLFSQRSHPLRNSFHLAGLKLCIHTLKINSRGWVDNMPAGKVEGPPFRSPEPVRSQGRSCACNSSTLSGRREEEAAGSSEPCGPASLAPAAERSKRPGLKVEGEGQQLTLPSGFHVPALTHKITYAAWESAFVSASVNLTALGTCLCVLFHFP